MPRDEHAISGPRALRALIKYEPIVRCLGVHDALSAKLVESAGLESIFVGGFGASASLLGLPDMNLLTLSQMVDAASRVIQAVKIPVIVDGDTGHGDLHNVARTVRLFETAGAAGILLEDQVTPKRCGHFEGKQVISADEMVLKIHAALDARVNPDLVIIARTDARAVHGLSDAIDRAIRYGEAGADLCYIEAPVNIDEIREIPQLVPYPLLLNMLTGGNTPALGLDEARELGYKVILWPIESVLVMAAAVRRLTRTLIERGRVDSLRDEMVSFKAIQDLLGLPELMDLRERIRHRAQHGP